jgi:hypothetical protein
VLFPYPFEKEKRCMILEWVPEEKNRLNLKEIDAKGSHWFKRKRKRI